MNRDGEFHRVHEAPGLVVEDHGLVGLRERCFVGADVAVDVALGGVEHPGVFVGRKHEFTFAREAALLFHGGPRWCSPRTKQPLCQQRGAHRDAQREQIGAHTCTTTAQVLQDGARVRQS
jgi:hypothetical protein